MMLSSLKAICIPLLNCYNLTRQEHSSIPIAPSNIRAVHHNAYPADRSHFSVTSREPKCPHPNFAKDQTQLLGHSQARAQPFVNVIHEQCSQSAKSATARTHMLRVARSRASKQYMRQDISQIRFSCRFMVS